MPAQTRKHQANCWTHNWMTSRSPVCSFSCMVVFVFLFFGSWFTWNQLHKSGQGESSYRAKASGDLQLCKSVNLFAVTPFNKCASVFIWQQGDKLDNPIPLLAISTVGSEEVPTMSSRPPRVACSVHNTPNHFFTHPPWPQVKIQALLQLLKRTTWRLVPLKLSACLSQCQQPQGSQAEIAHIEDMDQKSASQSSGFNCEKTMHLLKMTSGSYDQSA